MIHPTDLRYFIELSKTLHVSRTAERLGLTQPALSHCLKRMETELGQSLFIRSKQGIVLTSAGRKLLEKAEGMALQWEDLKASVAEDADEVSGVIKVGCHTAVAQYTLPVFLPSLLRDHPRLELRLEHGLSRHMTEGVVSHMLDVALAVNPVAHPDLVIKEVCRDQMTLWKSRECLNPDVLLVDSNLLQTQDLLQKLARQGRHFRRTIGSSSLEVLCQLLAAGTGAAILPERVIRAISESRIEKLKGAPVFEDRICLVFRREFLKQKRGKVFVSEVLAKFR